MNDNIEYEIIRSKRKTISMQIKSDGHVVVRAPLRLSQKSIDEFVVKNADWIEKSKLKVQDRNAKKEQLEQFSEKEITEFKKMARKQLLPMIEELAPIVGVVYGRVSIRAQKSRWGSCSREGNLNFNCLLVMTPASVQRYVIVHELCHRKEMNHSANFWAEVERIVPDYREQRKWLKKNGGELIQRLPK